ncbi:MAG: BlaI/MecI/CopY family transcriptional regulator [Sedimentisphaerales bacterium]|jgi:predicted transcriptional regulator|nr:BlaI/MecI/CopY family transcriptional regulator [Sedimentisphaerales bacterium]HNY79844.1 BlaI/MecI/CopY family transcriptional regulator [Sedimentisphaerales bacterium]HOC64846.1 BlaI/MecI/CopY family transcriptional regulator [Sedimentisphaerales bacterium]HOH65776.1 BlaI/MecI/CopY family transcriptional regulator [Sedimentisphaerales bacterium]HPY50638.1 BlaI/MecI/CopY family transcriptional regulator [Sedimentisphaerales bacterium]
MATRDHELTEAEWEIIQVVWAHEPCAAPTVQEELQARKKWTYSTVKTLMDRMVVKGLLTTERIRNLILYRSAITQKQARKGEVAKTLARAFGGAFTPMMQFLLESQTLSDVELAELESMIRKKRRRERGRGE